VTIVVWNVGSCFRERQTSSIDGLGEIRALISTASEVGTNRWLLEHGPREVSSLILAVVYSPSPPLELADVDHLSRKVNIDAARLLPVRLSPVPSDKSADSAANGHRDANSASVATGVTAPERDFAPFLLDTHGRIVAWYAGAERIYGYKGAEVAGKHLSFFCTDEDASRQLSKRLNRAAIEGYNCSELWQVRSEASRFRANLVTAAIKDEHGDLQGFAVVVRDFSNRDQRDEKLRRSPTRSGTAQPAVVGVISGEFDCLTEANDTFLELVGYSREDLYTGRLHWPALTPPEFRALEEIAHDEGLRFGACAPYEKELIGKDGKRIRVLLATAVLKLSPFRWITFVSDLREHDRQESIEDKSVGVKSNFEEIIGASPVMIRVLAQVEVVAPTDATVLVLGETGTGKELIARAVHRISPRRNLPFISLNCAAIPTGLLESELFGYERGAFTGALSQKIGRFEMANRGTLFLDEVGDIPLNLQPKLLRALQEKSFERLGGTRTISIDVRLVAATNRDLKQMMGDKLFRSDLYYRLKVFPITTPPLRDHPEDIPILARHFTRKYAARLGRTIEKIPTDTMKALVSWRWPGNVRELENFIERSVILSRGPSLCAPVAELMVTANETNVGSSLEEVEREYVLRVFRETGGIVSATATRLRIPRTTLNAMMMKLGISRNDL
jgi:formate hydrogenlyase transcriptional activator